MSGHFNELTPAEAERLALLLEEMGEAQQVIGKILRHGYESRDPTDPDSIINRGLLEKELGDVLCAIDLMIEAHDVDQDDMNALGKIKYASVKQWLHHQRRPDPPDIRDEA